MFRCVSVGVYVYDCVVPMWCVCVCVFMFDWWLLSFCCVLSVYVCVSVYVYVVRGLPMCRFRCNVVCVLFSVPDSDYVYVFVCCGCVLLWL